MTTARPPLLVSRQRAWLGDALTRGDVTCAGVAARLADLGEPVDPSLVSRWASGERTMPFGGAIGVLATATDPTWLVQQLASPLGLVVHRPAPGVPIPGPEQALRVVDAASRVAGLVVRRQPRPAVLEAVRALRARLDELEASVLR